MSRCSLTLTFALFVSGLAACSLVGHPSSPSPSSGSSPGLSASAVKPTSPFEQICAVATAEIGPKLNGDPQSGNASKHKQVFRDALLAADRKQFVVATIDKEGRYTSDGRHFTKRTIKAGEPLQVLSCTTYGGKYVKVSSVDGLFELSFAPQELVLSPPSFSIPEPDAEVEFEASDAVNNADKRDRDQIPGLAALSDKFGTCAETGLGACMSAESKIEHGPPRADLEAAKHQACDAARTKAMASCVTAKERTDFVAMAKKVHTLTAQRDAAFRAAMQAKLK